MNIVICGAGHVGYHSAEVLAAAGHRVTVIDSDADAAAVASANAAGRSGCETSSSSWNRTHDSSAPPHRRTSSTRLA